MLRRIAGGAGLAALALFVFGDVPARAQSEIRQGGYLTARDGTRLRYDLRLPGEHKEGDRRPAVLHYDGYAAGSDVTSNTFSWYRDRFQDLGFAVIGVSVRGTGCSQGEFDPFDTTMGTDGYDAVEWIVDQPWSDGRVGMAGHSFGAVTQLLVAATRPPHLRAIAPASPLGDLYRDIAYPGGAYEYGFPLTWTALQKQPGIGSTADRVIGSDSECGKNFVAHEQANASRENIVATFHLDNPWADSRGGMWQARSPVNGFDRIDVPVYISGSWQDEQVRARWFGDLDRFRTPGRVWVDVSNGSHVRQIATTTTRVRARTVAFLNRFVRDVDNGFTETVPRLTVGMETTYAGDFAPRWEITSNSRLRPTSRNLYLGAGEALTTRPPAEHEQGDTFGYPLPSSSALETGLRRTRPTNAEFAWKAPVPPGGAVAYLSGELERDLIVAGPASLDLWLQTTGTDLDLQATLTEVRPDGQEAFVQRGWLRASHRALDPSRSTDLRPYHTHREADAAPLPRLEPTFLRLEIWPFAHAFRQGSRVRVSVEAPTGHTGQWAFVPTGEPQAVTVLHDREHPSKLVLGELEGEVVPEGHRTLPTCDTLVNQPCRPAAVAP